VQLAARHVLVVQDELQLVHAANATGAPDGLALAAPPGLDAIERLLDTLQRCAQPVEHAVEQRLERLRLCPGPPPRHERGDGAVAAAHRELLRRLRRHQRRSEPIRQPAQGVAAPLAGASELAAALSRERKAPRDTDRQLLTLLLTQPVAERREHPLPALRWAQLAHLTALEAAAAVHRHLPCRLDTRTRPRPLVPTSLHTS
jgi:hypothetical protein